MRLLKGGKIKIVRIIARLNIGGPAIHTILLTGGVDRKVFTTHFAAGRPDASEGDMAYFAEQNKVDVNYISGLGRQIGLGDFLSFIKILGLLIKIKPDIIHTHTAKAGALGRVAGVFAGVPVKIHTFHGHIFDGYFDPVKTKIFIFIEKFLGIFTDKVIVVSESIRNEIVDKLKIVPGGKCVVIRLGFDLGRFLNNERHKGAIRREFNIAHDTLLVGIVGRLVPIKNHKMFLKAARKVIDRMPGKNLKFLIVGDGESRQYLEKEVCKMGMEKYVIFTGWIRDIDRVYADLDIAALTSLNEGTPVSLIEAMASAKPVVATSVGGVIDIVRDGENGLLAGPDDADDFSDKIISLLKDGKRREEMGLKGRDFAKSNFHKERLIKETEGLYLSCLEAKGI
ncbi:MAG: glycosyltransferase family 4 protein [Candidatus Omnitrophota bacterium]|nr:glycosyltransferase family 4 protein [Candidatus Omnitrophota bacterium]